MAGCIRKAAAPLNYYKRHLGDYARAAGHLSMLEHGAYNLVMDAYYDREEAPTRAEALRVARAKSPEEIAAVDVVLAEFFKERDGRFYQKRVEEELAEFRQRQATNREIGAKGGLAKAKRNASDSLDDRLAKPKPSHKPLATNHDKQEQEPSASRAERAQPVVCIPTNTGEEFPITELHVTEFRAAYPAVDVLAKLREMRAWSLANPSRRKTSGGMLRFANAWLAKAQNEAPHARAGPAPANDRMAGVSALEDLKNGLAARRNPDGIAEAVPAAPAQLTVGK